MRKYIYLCIFLFKFASCSPASTFEQQKIQSFQSCQTDGDCKPNSFCYGNDDNQRGKCKCLDGFDLERTEDFYQCLKSAAIGEACVKRFQCLIKGGVRTECVNNKCQCVEDSYPNEQGRCTPKTLLNSICMSADECSWIPNAGCLDGLCVCKVDMKPSADQRSCLSNATLGGKCTSDDNCNNEQLRCNNRVCVCKQDYVTSRNNVECLPAAKNFGEACLEDAQCGKFLERSICTNGKCACTSEMQPYGSKCVLETSQNGECLSETDCSGYEQETVKCTNRKCECIYGQNSDGCKTKKNENVGSGSQGFSNSLHLIYFLWGFMYLIFYCFCN